MLTYFRYTLAAICLAASLGCLAMWWRSYYHRDVLLGPGPMPHKFVIGAQSCEGYGTVRFITPQTAPSETKVAWQYESRELSTTERDRFLQFVGNNGRFIWHDDTEYGKGMFFPFWYPALVFALAAVAAFRIGRFTLRSALVGTSVVAALLGMVVAL
ncbi:hypothetical protein [Lacipirellula sp.]|uniref:hypothetical protein n=1 Tax=Lacipirellula sp. TaxID=2691419 RepID=UPI003D11F41C